MGSNYFSQNKLKRSGNKVSSRIEDKVTLSISNGKEEHTLYSFKTIPINIASKILKGKVSSKEGKYLWKTNIGSALNGAYPLVFLSKDTLLAASRNRVFYALDKTNGNIVWKKEADFVNLAKRGDFYTLLYKDKEGNLNIFSPVMGHSMWKKGVPLKQTYGDPIIHKDKIYILQKQNKSGEKEILSIDYSTGKVIWRKSTGVLKIPNQISTSPRWRCVHPL